MNTFASHRLRILALLVAACIAALGADPTPTAAADRPAFVPGQVLLRFRPGASPGQIKAVLRDLGATRGKRFHRTRVEHHRIRGRVEDAVARFRNNPALEFIEPDYIVHADAVPNDPLFPLQWSLRNTGQGSGLAGADIDAVGAWDQATGSSQVIVAIVDSGMDWRHPDLAANVFTNPGEIPDNQIDDDGNGYVDDVHGFDFYNYDGDPSDENGHGTHVSGIIGAVGNNGIGIAGVAWRVQLLPAKFLGPDGSGATSSAIAAIEYAVDMGAIVLNNSWGGGPPSESLRLAIANANEAGALFVAAAGNNSSNNDLYPDYPSSYHVANVISVASSSRTDTRSEFSNYGAASVDLAAPGTLILSTVPGGETAVKSGTSMAAPHVSGALALLKSRYPTMLPATMKNVLFSSTDRIPALEGLVATGGRLNVLRMMAGPDSVPPGRIGTLAVTSASSDQLTVTWIATGDDGSTGTATRYDLRIEATPIDDATFPVATRVTSAPLPQAAGAPEQTTIRGLAPLTNYFIAVKALDEYGNVSPLSNVIEARTTAPPLAVVSPARFDGTRLTGLSETQALRISNAGAGSLDFTVQIAGVGGAGPPSWLGVAPRSGSTLAGATSELTVTLNAAGLAGGNYDARLLVGTNDPDHRLIEVPVRLSVVSASDIDVFPPSVTFGPVVVATTKFQTIAVTNAGFADLHVSGVSVNDPRFTVDPGAFDLGPGGYWEIRVGVTPSAPGPASGTITILSDDPDESTLRVSVGANGIVPGVLTLSPPRLDAALETGAVATSPITLSNTGGSTLSWGVRARAAGALAATSADLSDVKILFDASHGGAGPGAWASLIGLLTGRGALLTVNDLPVGSPTLDATDILWVTEGTKEWAPAELDAVEEWLDRGGSLLVDGEAASSLPFFNGLLSATGAPILYAPAAGATGATTRLLPHEITRDAAAAHLAGSAARLDIQGPGATVVIEDAAGAPAMVSVFAGRGRVLAVAGGLLADFASIYGDNQRIRTQAFEWLGGAGWLSVTPAFGTTQPGKSSVITARIDGARLVGGTYRAELLVTANDPTNPQTMIPVELELTSAPDIAASPATIHFGPVFVGAKHTEAVHLQNVGTAPLTIESIEANAAEISLEPVAESLTLAPGERRDVPLTYAPGAIAPIAGTIVVRSNDPDAPSVSVTFDGEGLAAPEIAISPESFTASLRTGSQVTRTLVVSNASGSDLEYRVRFLERAATASAPAPAESPAGESYPAPLQLSWTERRALALADSGRAASVTIGGSALGATEANLPGSTLPLVVLDPEDDGGVLDVAAIYASGRDGVLTAEIVMVEDFAPLNFGGFLSLDLDQNAATGRPPSFAGPRQELGAEYEIGFFSVSFGYADLFDARNGAYLRSFPVTVTPRSVRFTIPLSALGDDDGRMDVTGVLGNPYGPTDWFPDRKHATVGGLWLVPSKPSGTVAAGQAAEVPLVVDARGLPEGNYAGEVLVESNDPDRSFLSLPAVLAVGGAAVIAVDTHPLLFAPTFLGGSSSASFEVGNQGTTLLTISQVASDSPEYIADVASFTLEPGATRSVGVVFTPSAAGTRQGGLHLVHDGSAEATEAEIPMTGEGVPPPALAVSPDSLAFSVESSGVVAKTITIGNAGGSTLRFSVGAQAGGPVALERGGPDGFGYRWLDSDQPGGPAFDWIDIRSIGTAIPIRNLDENSGPLPIGFEFPFYGRSFTSFRACTHGWISFTNGDVQFNNRPLPDPNAPENLLAVYWDDLNFAQSERAWYYSDGERLIVQYDRVLHRVAGGPYTFEAILDRSGAVVFQYLQMGEPLNSGTIGIQNSRKDDGLAVTFNQAYVKDRLAIRFMPSPRWLAADPLDGAVLPGGTADVTIAADSKDLLPGKYRAALRVSSNDPARAVTLLPVVFRVGPLPAIDVNPGAVEFGTVTAGATATRAVWVVNRGTADLHVGSVVPARAEFTIAPSPGTFALAAGESAEVSIVFEPAEPGSYDTTLRIESDDPDGARVVPLQASAKPPPPAIVDAIADLNPTTLQRGSRGQAVRARIYLPADLDAALVNVASIRLQGVVPPADPIRLGDWNGDGRLDLEARFDRAAVERALPDGERVPVEIAGDVTGASSFAARDTIRVVSRRLAAYGLEMDASEAGAPVVHALHPNAPNPFHPATTIGFDVAADARVTLRVFTAAGRLARTIVAIDALPAGRYRARWDGRDDAGREMGSGVYFARLTVAGGKPFAATRRMLLVR